MTTPTGGSGGPNNTNTWFPPNPHAQHAPQYIAQHAPQPPPPIYTNLPPPPRTPQQHQRYSAQQTPTRQTPRPGGAPEPPAVLLALAETYFEAAHKSGYAVAVKRPGEEALDAQAYCKLVATGLGCLEAALQVGCPFGETGEDAVLMGLVSAATTGGGDGEAKVCECAV